jgi:ABC-type uncharacterized transport system substrate-binding protein
MSSGVVGYAQKYNSIIANPIKIVGIVSDPTQEDPNPNLASFASDANICGYSAQRHQTAASVFRNFVNSVIPNLTTVVVLHKANYNASAQALKHIADDAADPNKPRINLVTVPVSRSADITSALHSLPIQPQLCGVLVLPADMLFAKGNDIIGLVQSNGIGTTLTQFMPTFFFATDWVRRTPQGLTPVEAAAASAFGAFGVPQQTCGQYMAAMVDYVLKNGATPGNRWVYAILPNGGNLGDFEWVVNTTVAAYLNQKPNPQVPSLIP